MKMYWQQIHKRAVGITVAIICGVLGWGVGYEMAIARAYKLQCAIWSSRESLTKSLIERKGQRITVLANSVGETTEKDFVPELGWDKVRALKGKKEKVVSVESTR